MDRYKLEIVNNHGDRYIRCDPAPDGSWVMFRDVAALQKRCEEAERTALQAAECHARETRRADALQKRVAELEASNNAVYEERNRVVALLAAVFPSVRARTAIEGWSEDWHGCIYVTLPTGQASWHYHDSHAHLFAHVPEGAATWDGHTTPEKYERVAATCAALTGGKDE